MKFASYAFNKSHAAAYTYLTYQTAYLKLYYPTHYIVAVVNNRITNADEVKHYMNYMKRKGVKILPPDINRSKKQFSIEGENVRYGLMGIKNVGEQAMEYLLEEREKNGEFKDIRDLLDRCGGQINKRMIESLIKGGALDCFGKGRATLMASYERIMDTVLGEKKNKLTGQMSLFDELIEDDEIKYSEVREYDKAQRLSYEREVLGMYISGHPLDDYEDVSGEFNFDTSQLLVEDQDEDGETVMVPDQSLDGKPVKFGCIVSSYEKKTTAKQLKFAVGRVEDKMGSVAFSMYPKVYERYGSMLDSEEPIKITGRVDLRDESEPKITIDRVEIWQNVNANKPQNSGSVVYVLLANESEKELVSGVLQMHPGATPVIAQVKENGKYVLKKFPHSVTPDTEFLHKLQLIVGEKNVKYVQKKQLK